MPSILDRLLGRTKKEEPKVEPQRVSEEAARARREELARERAEMEAARLRAEESEKQRLAALEAEKKAQAQAELEKLAKEEQERLAAKVAGGAAAAVKATEERVYVVKSGDSLSKIAKELYGDAKRWPEIYEANKQLIGDNPNLIHPGQKLRIP